MTSNSQLKLVSILMVDSIRLCGNTQTSLTNAEDVPSFSKVPSSFTNAASMAALYFQDLENQLKTISASGVPYIIVGSHFPIFSVAEHGSTQCLINSLMPLLHKYKVSLYLSGHDHNLQHISYTYLNSTVEYMVVGANALNSNSQANINSVPPNSLKFQWPTKGNIISNIVNDALLGGFLAITASPVGMTVNFIKAGPPSLLSTQPFTVLYTKNILPRV
jgi:tartrate-resistant acid phosphatase type 5